MSKQQSSVDVLTGNKLIAEFMGCYGVTHWAGGEEVYRWGFKNTHITERWHESDFIDQTPYHSSWDWLKPVIDKLYDIATARRGELNDKFHERKLSIFNAPLYCGIKDAFEMTIEAITWYNNTQTKKQ